MHISGLWGFVVRLKDSSVNLAIFMSTHPVFTIFH